MVRPFPAFSWLANVSRRGDLTWASSSSFSKTNTWGLERNGEKKICVLTESMTADSPAHPMKKFLFAFIRVSQSYVGDDHVYAEVYDGYDGAVKSRIQYSTSSFWCVEVPPPTSGGHNGQH